MKKTILHFTKNKKQKITFYKEVSMQVHTMNRKSLKMVKEFKEVIETKYLGNWLVLLILIELTTHQYLHFYY